MKRAPKALTLFGSLFVCMFTLLQIIMKSQRSPVHETSEILQNFPTPYG